jgi:cytochrome P450
MTAIAELPGPHGLPLLGNALQLYPGRLHVTLERWGRRYGPAFRFTMGKRPVVAFAEPETVNAILRERPDGYRRWRELERVADELRLGGPFTAEGDDWRRQRRLAVTALNANHLRRYFEVVHTATGRLHDRLERKAGTPVEILDDLMAYSVDITSALAFGHDLNTLEHGDGELQRHITSVFELLARRTLSPAPYWHLVKPPADRAAERSIEVIHAEIDTFIAAARRRMEERPELKDAPENFLESMLTMPGYDDHDVFANVFTMLLAGEDTTANTLSWALYLLARDPAAQRRLQAEADTALGAERIPAAAEVVDRMRFAEAVFRESARLKATAPLLFFEPNQDTVAGGVQLPQGTRIVCLTRQIGRPLRRERFDPDRWLTDGTDPRSFLAFGAGPRFCPGRNLAFLEGKTALAMLARNFSWEPAGAEPREHFGFTMRPTGLRVKLHPRKVPASKH